MENNMISPACNLEHKKAYFCIMKNQDNIVRCGWCGSDPLYIKYHDEEWGKEVCDDLTLFEFLVLESAQAGLSWITILRRREGYRRAFAGFDPKQVAALTQADIERLMQDASIIQNRLKISATISNAQQFIAIQKEFGAFRRYLQSFLPEGKPVVNHWKNLSEIPVSTPLSDAISKDMKRRGFKFFGTTICYAYLQATGYVDDHLVDCFCR
jgi:DNA-3-methyladenine glycosylase I